MGLRDSILEKKPEKPTDFTIAPLTDIEELPITNYRFMIMMGSDKVALFQKISNISVERKTEEIVEGGYHNHTWEFPKHFSYNHIKFEVGLTSTKFFYDWMMQGVDHGYAIGTDFTLKQQDPKGDDVRLWNFFGAFPVKWQISDLGIGNSKAIVVEKLELSFNYFEAA
jgi:phage tail-like protein